MGGLEGRWKRRITVSVLLVAVVTGACSSSDNPGRDNADPAQTTTTQAVAVPHGFDGAVPSEVAASKADWPTAGRDYDNSRATTDSTINASNVGQLDVAWTTKLAELGSLSTAPLVVGNRVYLQGGSSRVAAIDRETGKVLWLSESTGFNIGPFGVAVGEGAVFALDGSTGAIALDTETGKVRWRRKLTATATTGIDIQPIVYGGMVFASTVPVSVQGIYAGGDRGVISALDAKTGAVRWSFDTVQSPTLWGNAKVNSGGGAWFPPAIDAANGLVLFGVANPAPFPGTKEFPNGTSRPGANLYTDSLVALDIKTGKLRWYHQVTPHDIFDRDQVHALIARGTGNRPIAVSAGKSGVLVGLDPKKGTALWTTEVGLHESDDLTKLDGPTVITPGTYGGVLTPPSTADGIVYAPVVNAPTSHKPDETSYFAADLDKQSGEIVAINATTGRIEWSRKVPGNPLGGTTVVNDLVLTTLLDGTILGLDRSDGKIVWTEKLPGGTNGEPSVAGDTVFAPVGNADPPQLVALHLP